MPDTKAEKAHCTQSHGAFCKTKIEMQKLATP